MKKLIFLRKVSQAFFLMLFVYILWSTIYPLKGMLPSHIFFRTNPHIMLITSISERLWIPGLAAALIMVLLTFIFGRFYCGWICPLGTMIDWTGARRKKKIDLSDKTNSKLSKIKFVLLGITFIFALGGIQIAWILDPMGITARFISIDLIPSVTIFMNNSFIFMIKTFGSHGPVYDLYNALKGSFLSVKVYYFSDFMIILSFFIFVLALSLIVSRAWCRAVCPLGAVYSLISRFAFLRRIVNKCTECGICRFECRMGAIKDDMSYEKGECILCMDCVYECPGDHTSFSFMKKKRNVKKDEKGMSRRDFLVLLIGAISALGFGGWRTRGTKRSSRGVIRPPMSLKEKDFVDRCIRCGNCIKVCPTNGLQPVMMEAGLGGIWTPQLVPEIGYCEYKCTVCGNVCPTGAIKKITEKEKVKAKLGTAKVNRTICLAWGSNVECLICEKVCPVSGNAIKTKEDIVGGRIIRKPVVDPGLCVGCGLCQTKCPTRPERAIRVSPEGETRT